MSKERPILFSAPMVRAILDDRKTQTRRIVKAAGALAEPHKYGPSDFASFPCPYGRPGDRLWVRETWADLRGGGFGQPFGYLANSLNRCGEEDGDSKRCRLDYGVKWRPSIFMPREASRITLAITKVRVERLQDISEDDQRAEGLTGADVAYGCISHPARAFADLWESINGVGSWNANPWVWVLEFWRVEQVAAAAEAQA